VRASRTGVGLAAPRRPRGCTRWGAAPRSSQCRPVMCTAPLPPPPGIQEEDVKRCVSEQGGIKEGE
jgi:hypothetical protein